MVAPAKLINPNAGAGWERMRVDGAHHVSQLAVWSRNGSIESTLGAIAVLGDLSAHAVQAGFTNAPAIYSMTMRTKQRNVVTDTDAATAITIRLETGRIPAGSLTYLLDYTENTYLFSGSAGAIAADGSITFPLTAGQLMPYQYGPHSVIGIIDPPGVAKPIVFEFWYARAQTGGVVPPEDLFYDGAGRYDGTYQYNSGA